jgi:hypothetical protein
MVWQSRRSRPGSVPDHRKCRFDDSRRAALTIPPTDGEIDDDRAKTRVANEQVEKRECQTLRGQPTADAQIIWLTLTI